MKSLLSPLSALFLLGGVLLSPGCLKDHCTHSSQYKVYSPVYRSLSDVRSAVKSEEPRDIRQTGKIYYYNGYLFINEPNQGIHVIDDQNPSSPKNISFIDIPGNIDLAAAGNILYADSYTDMVAIDISNPINVKVTQRVENVFPLRNYNYGFSAQPDGRGIITGFTSKDTVVKSDCDINMVVNQAGWYYDAATDMSFALQSSAVPPPSVSPAPASVGGSMARFALLHQYLYTVNQGTMNLYNVSQPASPVSEGSVNLGRFVETILPYKNNLFIGSNTGMLIYDAANPAQPVFKGNFSHFYSCDPVVAQNGYAYVTLRNGTSCRQNNINEMDVVNISDVSNPYMEGSLPLTNPKGLAIDGTNLFVCDGPSGVRLIDVSNVQSPKIVTTVGNIDAYDAIALNGILVVVAKDGLYQYDYHNFSNPKLLSKISIASK
jgi:hypothetical protein